MSIARAERVKHLHDSLHEFKRYSLRTLNPKATSAAQANVQTLLNVGKQVLLFSSPLLSPAQHADAKHSILMTWLYKNPCNVAY